MSEQELKQQFQELWDEKRKNGTFDDDDFFWQQALEFHDHKREFEERYFYTQKHQETSATTAWVIVLILITISFAINIAL